MDIKDTVKFSFIPEYMPFKIMIPGEGERLLSTGNLKMDLVTVPAHEVHIVW